MRIRVIFALPPNVAAAVRKRWVELRGTQVDTVAGSANPALLAIADEAVDGANVRRLLQEFAPDSSRWLVQRFADYSPADLQTAELVELLVASFDAAADPNTIRRASPCASCGSPDYWGTTVDGRPPRISNPKSKGLDFWRLAKWLVVSDRLAATVASCSGAILERLPVAPGLGGFHALRGRSSLGYPTDGTVWHPRCETCGRRDGIPPAHYVENLPRYPRTAWNGDDIVGGAEAQPAHFFSQRAWQILTSQKWRTPTGEMPAFPVQLVLDQEPIR